LNSNLTFSVLPFSPFGRSIAKKLSDKGAQLMLHLPMEPVEYPEVNPGPGALLSSMTPDKLLEQLRKNIIEVPGVVGVNNHMGSKLTADSDKMNQIFTILKKQDLFFIDSRTSPVSRGQESARLFKLRFAQRDIFLDNSQNIPYISGQFGRLIKIAQKHGIAIGIGHPYKSTLEALKIELPKLNGRIRIVPASHAVTVLE
ncbi:MAG: divergent polysaccharide deacetylase family protein, partial [Proteobacteria bacterium]|nr:divergent polysaccharide deacetylase family protein [Pseudomonadota bacterium]